MSVIHNYVSFPFILFLCFHPTFSSTLHFPDTYYDSTIYTEPTEALKYWVDIDEMSNVTLQPMLSESQHPPAPVNLTFEFLYHGHPINNVTIATEGFLHLGNPIKNVIAPYISNPIPSWLADIQNVAPLLTDLYESSWLYESSKIKYAGNSTMFVVQWENFTCEELPQKFFTFQVSLFPNGDIVFVYKDFPVSFRDMPFTIRAELSDGYIFNKTLNGVQRTTINEYSRIKIFLNACLFIEDARNASIYFSAKRTCNTLVNRESCSIGIKGLSCKWCDAVERCSDGYDRMRQQWLQNDCPTGCFIADADSTEKVHDDGCFFFSNVLSIKNQN